VNGESERDGVRFSMLDSGRLVERDRMYEEDALWKMANILIPWYRSSGELDLAPLFDGLLATGKLVNTEYADFRIVGLFGISNVVLHPYGTCQEFTSSVGFRPHELLEILKKEQVKPFVPSLYDFASVSWKDERETDALEKILEMSRPVVVYMRTGDALLNSIRAMLEGKNLDDLDRETTELEKLFGKEYQHLLRGVEEVDWHLSSFDKRLERFSHTRRLSPIMNFFAERYGILCNMGYKEWVDTLLRSDMPWRLKVQAMVWSSHLKPSSLTLCYSEVMDKSLFDIMQLVNFRIYGGERIKHFEPFPTDFMLTLTDIAGYGESLLKDGGKPLYLSSAISVEDWIDLRRQISNSPVVKGPMIREELLRQAQTKEAMTRARTEIPIEAQLLGETLDTLDEIHKRGFFWIRFSILTAFQFLTNDTSLQRLFQLTMIEQFLDEHLGKNSLSSFVGKKLKDLGAKKVSDSLFLKDLQDIYLRLINKPIARLWLLLAQKNISKELKGWTYDFWEFRYEKKRRDRLSKL